MLSSWEDGNHFKCMIYFSPRKWRLSDHDAVCISHSSGWLLLDDVHSDHLGTLLALVVGRIVSRFLVADVNRDIIPAGLSSGRSASSRAGGRTGPPALVPLDFELPPLALQGGLDLGAKGEPRIIQLQEWAKQSLYAWLPGAYQRLKEATFQVRTQKT